MDNVELTNQRVVAIDGGTATGKGRLIEELAALLRSKGVPVIYLSTGSLYRAVAYVALEQCRPNVPDQPDQSASAVTEAALELVREMTSARLLAAARERQVEMHGGLVWIDGGEASVNEQLKGPGVGMGASIVSIPVPVREFVNATARRQVNEFDGYVLIDGRDTTHTVVPDAPIKLLLTVAPHIAAQRSQEHTVEEIVRRDEADRRKQVGALQHPDDPGDGVVVLSTDSHTPETVRDQVYDMMRQVFGELPEL